MIELILEVMTIACRIDPDYLMIIKATLFVLWEDEMRSRSYFP